MIAQVMTENKTVKSVNYHIDAEFNATEDIYYARYG
ncbi:Uncharacterised protein [Shigella sonnei]|nr:Uncharacterised protein [Shigella sonnei]CSR42981.1 Uncharacterised protein [Shigella sonnei]CSS45385.1 Uncharacterised protein [Shigella sonnei]SRT52606.1 Uncharacterised protein [Shigella sonnei]